MNNNENENYPLSTSYWQYQMEGISALVDAVENTINAFITPQFQTDMFDNLSEAIAQLVPTLDNLTKNIDYDAICATSKKLLECFKPLSLLEYDFSSLVEKISLEEDCVMIDDDAIDALTEFFSEQEKPVRDISSQMSIKDFLLTILLPLLCMLLPMVQNSYYHKLDAIEAQQNQMQEAEYQEAILNLETQHAKELEELNNNITELLNYLESVQGTDLLDADVQEMSLESLPVEVEVDDVSDNQDTNQSSD